MNIAIVDNNRLLPDLLQLSLEKLEGVDSVYVYTCANQFLAHLNIIDLDILIVDSVMQQMSGIEIVKELRKFKGKPDLKVLVLSDIKNATMITEAFKAGANGYLCKDTSMEELVSALKFINLEPNKPYVGKSIKDLILQAQLSNISDVQLSPREKELLNYLCNAKTVKEIAAELQLSVLTIQSYLKQLMRKMEVNRTADLILKAIKSGLFHPGL